MAYKIIVKKRFTNKIQHLLTYLKSNWGNKVTEDFILKLEIRIQTISNQPNIGASSKKIKKIRGILVTRHIKMYYRVQNNTIEILNFYDTRINPNKNIY